MRLCRLVTGAVPTLFQVPNPPPQLESSRPAPKRRKQDQCEGVTLTVGVEEERSSAQLTRVYVPRFDHTYCAISVLNVQDSTRSGALTTPKPVHTCSETSDLEQCSNGTDVLSTQIVRSRRPIRRQVLSLGERRLRKIILRQRVTICRLKKRLTVARKNDKKFETPGFQGIFGKRLGAFFARQSKLSTVKKFGRRFSPADKNFALSLYFAGPKAYAFCQQLFILPSKRSLQLWLSRLNIKPGFSESILALLAKKNRSMGSRDKQCVLLLDEMSLKTGLTYDASKDIIVGYENFGDLGTGKDLANSALVFMVKGLYGKWKQPIGYFLSHNTAPGVKLKTLVMSAIEKLSNIGLIVRVVICDQGSTNQQMFRLFNVTVDKPVAQLYGRQVVFMFDPPHLLKSIRNNLMKYDFLIGDKLVSWKYIKEFYESDSSLKIRMAPKLSKKHIELPPFAAMRVFLAAQVLSHTVAAGISTYVALGRLPDEASFNADFLETVDGLFELF